MTDKPLDILNVQLNLGQEQVLDVLNEELILAKADSIRDKRLQDRDVLQGEIKHMTRTIRHTNQGAS